jgi:hypothetical protein
VKSAKPTTATKGHEREVLMAMPDGRLAYVAPGSQWVRIAPLRFAQLI